MEIEVAVRLVMVRLKSCTVMNLIVFAASIRLHNVTLHEEVRLITDKVQHRGALVVWEVEVFSDDLMRLVCEL